MVYVILSSQPKQILGSTLYTFTHTFVKATTIGLTKRYFASSPPNEELSRIRFASLKESEQNRYRRKLNELTDLQNFEKDCTYIRKILNSKNNIEIRRTSRYEQVFIRIPGLNARYTELKTLKMTSEAQENDFPDLIGPPDVDDIFSNLNQEIAKCWSKIEKHIKQINRKN